MKKLYKYASGLLLTGALTIVTILNADAQRGAAHASGGVRIGGGGGFRGGIGFGSGFGFRPGLGINLGFGSGFYRPGFGSYGYPHLGFFINALPLGYYPFIIGADQYYYSGGIFYRPYNDGGYVVTAPPVGAMVPALPHGTKSIMIDGNQYYVFNGVYYKSIQNDKGEYMYVVAGKDGVLNTDSVNATQLAPKVGDIVERLPDNCHRINLSGKVYMVSPDSIYYEETTDRNGNVVYRIATIPSDQDNK